MKTLKSLFSILLISFALITVASCGDESTDPTPVKTTAQLNLEKVQASIGTSMNWTFKSVSVTEITSSKNGKTSDCAKTELKNANFGNVGWRDVTPIMNLKYKTGNYVDIIYSCSVADDPNIKVSIVQDSDTNFTLNIAPFKFTVNSEDVTTSLIRVTLISNGTLVSSDIGYIVVYEFTR